MRKISLLGLSLIFTFFFAGQSVFAQDVDLTNLVVNNDFELAVDANCNPVIVTDGMDGDPDPTDTTKIAWKPTFSTCPQSNIYGWTWSMGDFGKRKEALDIINNTTGSVNNFLLGNNSQGLNKDIAPIETMHGNFACWIGGSIILPSFVEFYQVIDKSQLTPGTYKVECRLAVGGTKRTSQRLFANQNVQYHGTESQYASNQTVGETATFANWSGSSDKELQEMVVYTTIGANDSLKIGIRTGSVKGDGTTAGTASPFWGWFKVDYFRVTKMAATGLNEAELANTSYNVNNRTLTVSGVASYVVYNINGVKVAEVKADGNVGSVDLMPGVYIVKPEAAKVFKVAVR